MRTGASECLCQFARNFDIQMDTVVSILENGYCSAATRERTLICGKLTGGRIIFSRYICVSLDLEFSSTSAKAAPLLRSIVMVTFPFVSGAENVAVPTFMFWPA